MTLKREGHHAEQQLSCRARAFSVEALLHRTTPQPLPCNADVPVNSTPEVSSSVEIAEASTSCTENTASRGLKRESTSPRTELRVELCSRDLWRKFHSLGTEMIITKAGRRMFPTVKSRLHGLHANANYIIFLDIIPVDDKRYRYVYHSSQWTVAGAGDPPLPRSLYVHPDSPASGQLWMAQGVISFDKLKLTNNRRPIVRGQVSLHSMHKYQPRVHVLCTEDLDTPAEAQVLAALQASSKGHNNGLLHSFTFPETSFTTVTAYQNQQITRLKIASNPFAKGFREASKTRDHMDESRPSYPRLPHFGNTDLMSPSPSYFPEFSPAWPSTSPLSMPVKFVIPPSSSMSTPLMPYLQQPIPYQCPPFRPHYLECLRPQTPHHMFPSVFPRAPEALDLSTFK